MANNIITTEPAANGIKIKLKLWLPIITISGFPPAGGCTVFVIIIIKIANPTPNPRQYMLLPIKLTIINPDNPDKTWPKKCFLVVLKDCHVLT